MAIEEPAFKLIEQAKPFCLRAYEPRIVAEVVVSGPMDEASSAGFRLLADYISGDNTVRADESNEADADELDRTTPVTMQPRSEKIRMTAPVSLEEANGKWRVSFAMPSSYTMETLPRPGNPAVRLREIPATRYAVIRFSGFTPEGRVAKKAVELETWMRKKGIVPLGRPTLARYDRPAVLPCLRRNEIMQAFE